MFRPEGNIPAYTSARVCPMLPGYSLARRTADCGCEAVELYSYSFVLGPGAVRKTAANDPFRTH